MMEYWGAGFSVGSWVGAFSTSYDPTNLTPMSYDPATLAATPQSVTTDAGNEERGERS